MPAIDPFPHRYVVSLANRELVAPPRAPIAAGAPPQFGGSDTVWSPEQLLVAAALECLWTTFEAYARHEALAIRRWSGTGTAVLDRGSPVPTFSSITLHVELDVDDADHARRLLDKAERRCIISHALKTPVTIDAVIQT